MTYFFRLVADMVSTRIIVLFALLLMICCHALPPSNSESRLTPSNKEESKHAMDELFEIFKLSIPKVAKFNTSAENCSDQDELQFHNDILGVPFAAELYDLSTVAIYLLKGCPSQAHIRFTELFHMLGEDKENFSTIVIDMSESLKNYQSMSFNSSSALISNQVNNNETLENILRPLQVLQSSIYKEQGVGFLQCEWARSDSYITSSSCQEVSPSTTDMSNTKYDWRYRTFTSLVEAKLSCEYLKDQCYGISKYPGNSSTYFHFKRCDNVIIEDNDEVLIKECSRKYTAIPQVINKSGGRRIYRRGTSHHTDIKVTMFSKKNYKGSQKEFPNYVEYVGKDWDNKVTSMKCSSECSIIAFEHVQFHGRQKSFVGDVPFVGHEKLNTISSLIVVPYKLSDLCYVLYEHTQYKGKSQRFCGDQILPESWKHTVSSLKLECNGCSVVAYDRDYVGHFKSFESDVDWIGSDWNDIIEAVQIRPWKYDHYEGQLMPDTIFYEHAKYEGRCLLICA